MGDWELHNGLWQDTMGDVVVDALITDPPYSARTHKGHNAGEKNTRSITGQSTRTAINYAAFTPDDARDLVLNWHERVRGWMVIFTDHTLAPAYEAAFREVGRYPFAPVPFILPRPRLMGDGPPCWAVWMMVARPRKKRWKEWRCTNGWYKGATVKDKEADMSGMKPVDQMRRVVADYANPGFEVADPFAGSGAILEACLLEGMACVGSEVVETRCEFARRRLTRVSESMQSSLFSVSSIVSQAPQGDLFE